LPATDSASRRDYEAIRRNHFLKSYSLKDSLSMKSKKMIALLIVIAILFGAWLFAALFFRFVKVPTGAMKNTILPGDRLVVSRFPQEIKRGDIIVFRYPKDTSILYVKRVIGLPGETIQIREHKVFINGAEFAEKRAFYPLDDTYENMENPLKEEKSEGEGNYTTFNQSRDEAGEDETLFLPPTTFGITEPFPIPQGHYFVLGDNRDDSFDSRYWGTVAKQLITGKPFLIYASVEQDKEGGEKIRWNRVFTKVK
jgi:signal peptidase I